MTGPFDALLDYKLLKGSHKFPGEAGGACLNEVAIVAAGLDYRAIGWAGDCPPCFSGPISRLVILLNDAMPDDVRQDLKRFVLRLAGTADAHDVERERTTLLVAAVVKLIAPIALRHCGRLRTAKAFEQALSINELVAAANELADGYGRRALWYLTNKSDLELTASEASYTIEFAAGVVGDAIARKKIWPVAIDILDKMLAIGNQAPTIDPSAALDRLKVALERGKAPAVPA